LAAKSPHRHKVFVLGDHTAPRAAAMSPYVLDRSRKSAQHLRHVGFMSERDQMPHERGGKLSIDEEAHVLIRPNDRVIDVLRGVFNRRRDIVVLKIGIIAQDIRAGLHPDARRSRMSLHPHPHSRECKAVLRAHRIGRNTVQAVAHARTDSIGSKQIIAKSRAQ